MTILLKPFTDLGDLPIQPDQATPTPVQQQSATALRTAVIQPATIQPGTIQPATIQPATIQPATIQPATIQPATIQPATVQPATVQPATVRPATVQPVALPTPVLERTPVVVQPTPVVQATPQPTMPVRQVTPVQPATVSVQQATSIVQRINAPSRVVPAGGNAGTSIVQPRAGFGAAIVQPGLSFGAPAVQPANMFGAPVVRPAISPGLFAGQSSPDLGPVTIYTTYDVLRARGMLRPTDYGDPPLPGPSVPDPFGNDGPDRSGIPLCGDPQYDDGPDDPFTRAQWDFSWFVPDLFVIAPAGMNLVSIRLRLLNLLGSETPFNPDFRVATLQQNNVAAFWLRGLPIGPPGGPITVSIDNTPFLTSPNGLSGNFFIIDAYRQILLQNAFSLLSPGSNSPLTLWITTTLLEKLLYAKAVTPNISIDKDGIHLGDVSVFDAKVFMDPAHNVVTSEIRGVTKRLGGTSDNTFYAYVNDKIGPYNGGQGLFGCTTTTNICIDDPENPSSAILPFWSALVTFLFAQLAPSFLNSGGGNAGGVACTLNSALSTPGTPRMPNPLQFITLNTAAVFKKGLLVGGKPNP